MNNNISKYFILTSLFFLLVGCVEGIMFPTKWHLQAFYSTLFDLPPEYVKPFLANFVKKIHTHINLIGWVGSSLMGLLYFAAPRISGVKNVKGRILPYCNLASHIAGLLFFTLGFHMIGIVGLKSGHAYGSEVFRAVAGPFKVYVLIGGILITISALIFTFNMVRILCFETEDNNNQKGELL